VDLNGVDVDWVRKQLTGFVDETRPINQSGNGLITARTAPECGRPRAIERVEVVRPILRRLYPEWESENPGSKNDEFESARDASRRLLARLDHLDEVNARLGGEDQSPRITASSLHHLIWGAAEAQWTLGQRHEAVLAAAKAVNSQLQANFHRHDVSEADLVRQAFTDKAPEPGKPRLRFNTVEDEQTRESLRGGAMEFGAGCFRAIRNPVGHRPNDGEVRCHDIVAGGSRQGRHLARRSARRGVGRAEGIADREFPGREPILPHAACRGQTTATARWPE
jgi:Protein of unknown function (Hypoth_ymh)